MFSIEPINPPDEPTRLAALTRSDSQAKPLGALGRLEQLGAWAAACQGKCPPDPLDNVRLVVFAGDHGVAAHGVSAYPSAITPIMVRGFLAGGGGINALARQHGVALRVLDIAVDDDLAGLPAELGRYKVRRSSGAIHLEDALSSAELAAALAAGDAIAAEEIAAGAQLLIAGDMGIGNTTPAAALIAAACGADAEAVTGRGTGVDDAGLARKRAVIAAALERSGSRDALGRLAALGSADMAAAVGFMIGAARRGVGVLVDGVIALAEAVMAEELAPGTSAWMCAGHRSPEPAVNLALARLGLDPIIDLGMRLGEGTGAVTALPILRSGALTLREVALLADLVGGA